MSSAPDDRTTSMLGKRRARPETGGPGKRTKAEVELDSETSLASPDLDLASAEDKQAENTPYVYKPLATPHTIRIFRLHAGTGDETLRGELVCTELEESAVVNRDDKRRLEPYLLRVKIGESAQLEEVEDLASLLQQYDRRTTPTAHKKCTALSRTGTESPIDGDMGGNQDYGNHMKLFLTCGGSPHSHRSFTLPMASFLSYPTSQTPYTTSATSTNLAICG